MSTGSLHYAPYVPLQVTPTLFPAGEDRVGQVWSDGERYVVVTDSCTFVGTGSTQWAHMTVNLLTDEAKSYVELALKDRFTRLA